MTIEEFGKALNQNDDEYLKFEGIESPPTRRPDLAAFLLLDQLVPGIHDIIAAAEHDEIWLDTDVEALAAVITPAQVLYLRRCGVRYSADLSSLTMLT